MIESHDKFWVIVPAAGIGRRMAGETPKQYLPLAGRTVIEWSIMPFLAANWIAGVVVAVAEGDRHWSTLAISRDMRLQLTIGGRERVNSVARAMALLASQARPDDWVLVHDAARPCLHRDDLENLKTELADHPVGGILGAPVPDTLKRASADGTIDATVSRENLWRAFTPQMFRFKLLDAALQSTLLKQIVVTDEASAIEASGFHPRLIAGRSDNIKVTLPADLALAEQVLRAQGVV